MSDNRDRADNETIPDIWISARLDSQKMELRLLHALNTCYLVHVWGMNWLKEYWVQNMMVLHHNELLPRLKFFLRDNGYGEGVTNYSMEMTLHRTINEFLEQLKPIILKGEDPHEGDLITIHLPNDVPKEAFTEVDVRKRKIWKRHLEEDGHVSTSYGNLWLEGEWTEQLKQQAINMQVGLDILPHLWYGLTIREPLTAGDPWQVRFNFVDIKSPSGDYRSQLRKETP